MLFPLNVFIQDCSHYKCAKLGKEKEKEDSISAGVRFIRLVRAFNAMVWSKFDICIGNKSKLV